MRSWGEIAVGQEERGAEAEWGPSVGTCRRDIVENQGRECA
jgi:hypothetical protein